jgi:hypothetical protein
VRNLAQRFDIEADDQWPEVSKCHFIAEGCNRKAYRGQVIQKGKIPFKGFKTTKNSVVIKVPRNASNPVNLLDDLNVLELAHEWAARFQHRFMFYGIPSFRYVNGCLGICQETGNIVQVEEELPNGTFLKFNEAESWAMKDEHDVWKTANFFSHWTYEESKGKLMITDVQGVYDDKGRSYTCTDPFVQRNAKDMAGWMAKHKCNEYCERFGLTQHLARKPLPQPPHEQLQPEPEPQPQPQPQPQPAEVSKAKAKAFGVCGQVNQRHMRGFCGHSSLLKPVGHPMCSKNLMVPHVLS